MFTLLWEPCGRCVCMCVCITLKCTGGCCHALLPASRRLFIHGYRRLFSLQLAEPSALLKKSALGWRGTYSSHQLELCPPPLPSTAQPCWDPDPKLRILLGKHYFISATQVVVFRVDYLWDVGDELGLQRWLWCQAERKVRGRDGWNK